MSVTRLSLLVDLQQKVGEFFSQPVCHDATVWLILIGLKYIGQCRDSKSWTLQRRSVASVFRVEFDFDIVL
jgi:hypothetical protein